MPVYEVKDQAMKFKDQAMKFKDLEAGDVFYTNNDTSEIYLKTSENLKYVVGGVGNCILMQYGGLYWLEGSQTVTKFNKVALS